MIKHRLPVPLHRKYLLAGILTVIPLWVSWLVFKFLLTQLSDIGSPWVKALAQAIKPDWPGFAHWLLEPWFQSVLAVMLTLMGLYLLGWATTRMLGKRLINIFESLMEKVPVVKSIYGPTKKFLSALQHQPDEQIQRIVLIEFPSPGMKALGFVTRVMVDADTGQKIAAVYVPTTPNPTSGYLEIVPLERITPTDWTLDEAMSFIILGGAISPEKLHYTQGVGSLSDLPQQTT